MKRLTILLTVLTALSASAKHPSLLLTQQGVKEIRANSAKYPLFASSLAEVLAEADKALATELNVPTPVDGGGGATHEQHKANYYAMYYCGIAYQLTGKTQYADYVDKMLGEYAASYPTWGFHPITMSANPGRIFWQSLNDYVWAVHTAIAYDCIHDYLSAQRRAYIETTLFEPMVSFIMDGLPSNTRNRTIFNMMHNHGTWATAAVGMLGMATDRTDWVNKALYGTDLTGKNGGFLMQLDQLFSPDGYFTEGAYYLRYAIWPFVLFASGINNNLPQLKIFAYRNGVLTKAVDVLVQMAYEGKIMTFNDALDKRYSAQEIIAAVDILYAAGDNRSLLTVAKDYQQKVLPTDAGFAVVRDIAAGKAQPLIFRSELYRDGADGSEGGVGIFRWNDAAFTLKATSHGLSHGHYDKLAIAYYDNGNEVLTDYGAVRFINIEAKNKGHYTRENNSWAMTTIAHNTVTVDCGSDFGGSIDVSSRYHSDFTHFDNTMMSAQESNAYPGVKMQRTVLKIDADFLQYPLLVDIFRVTSDKPHRLDYPFWFAGQIISFNFPMTRNTTSMPVFGEQDGYKHLWVEALGYTAYEKYNADPTGETCAMARRDKPTSCFTWLVGDRFYSINTLTNSQTEMRIVRLGANDPDFNLRPQQGFIITEPNATNHTFFSTIETHGIYDLQVEQTANATSSVQELRLLEDTAERTIAEVTFVGGQTLRINIDNSTGKHTETFYMLSKPIYIEP